MYIDDPFAHALGITPNPELAKPDISEYTTEKIPAWNKGIPHSPEQMELIRDRVSSGEHNFCGPENNRRMIERGTHAFVVGAIQRECNQQRVLDGTHNLLGPEHALKRMQQGSHPFQHLPTLTCPHCGQSGKSGPMRRWHFDNCKHQ